MISQWLLPILIVVCFVGVIVYFIFKSLRGQISEEENPEGLPLFAVLFLKLIRPVIPVFKVILPTVRLHRKSAVSTYVRDHLDSAGLYEMDEEDVMASQFVLALALYLVFLAFLGSQSVIILLPLLLVGWGYPLVLLKKLAEERKARIYAELPYVLDLLSLGIEAGLDFKMAVERLVIFSGPGPLINELKGLLNDLNFGTPMEEALLRLRRRIDILAFFTFVEALIQATQMGIDVSSTLRAQAEQMRVAYFQSIEKQANKLPIMVLFPTAFCIFPPILLITLGPIVVDIVNNPAFSPPK